MKKFLSILLCLIVVVASCFALVGCTSVKAEVNLYTDDLVSEVLHGKAAAKEIKTSAEVDDVWIVKLKEKTNVDTLVLEEKTDAVTSFGIYGKDDDGSLTLLYKQNRIDAYRVCALESMVTDELHIQVYAKTGKVNIKNIKVYNSNTVKRSTPFRVTDYLQTTERKLSNNENNAEFYNHLSVVDDLIMYGDIYMGADGNIVYQEGKEDFAKDVEVLKSLKAKAKNNDMKIVASIDLKSKIDGKNDKKINTTIGKMFAKKNRPAIVANIVNFITEFDIDGVDLNWDYPTSDTQWANYSKLIVELDTELEARGKYVTVAMFPWDCKLSKKARNAVEYVNLQSYDMYDERGEHASQFETAKLSVQSFLKKSKFAPEKVMLGLPFYGRTTNKSSYIFDPYEYFETGQMAIDKWVNKIYNYRFTDGTIETYSDVYFNGYAMICDKTTYAISSGLGGVSIFAMQYDVKASNQWSLHTAVKETIKSRVEVAPV